MIIEAILAFVSEVMKYNKIEEAVQNLMNTFILI